VRKNWRGKEAIEFKDHFLGDFSLGFLFRKYTPD